jgi:hypothetical protein
MRYMFDVAKCNRIFDYLLQEKQIKLPSGHVTPSPEQLKKHAYCKWHNSYSHATNDDNIFHRQVQSVINKGRLKFTESPQMKLNNDLFPVNMNMVELKGKKVLVWPSQAETAKVKEVVIGEERPPMMIKPKSPNNGEWQKNEGGKPQRRPMATSDILMAKYKEVRAGIRGVKIGPSGMPNRTIQFH